MRFDLRKPPAIVRRFRRRVPWGEKGRLSFDGSRQHQPTGTRKKIFFKKRKKVRLRFDLRKPPRLRGVFGGGRPEKEKKVLRRFRVGASFFFFFLFFLFFCSRRSTGIGPARARARACSSAPKCAPSVRRFGQNAPALRAMPLPNLLETRPRKGLQKGARGEIRRRAFGGAGANPNKTLP